MWFTAMPFWVKCHMARFVRRTAVVEPYWWAHESVANRMKCFIELDSNCFRESAVHLLHCLNGCSILVDICSFYVMRSRKIEEDQRNGLWFTQRQLSTIPQLSREKGHPSPTSLSLHCSSILIHMSKASDAVKQLVLNEQRGRKSQKRVFPHPLLLPRISKRKSRWSKNTENDGSRRKKRSRATYWSTEIEVLEFWCCDE